MKLKLVEVGLALALVGTIVSGFATTWTHVNPNYYGRISMSADGRIVCVVPSTTGSIQISTNWGQNWLTATNVSGIIYPDSLALSADGSKIFAYLETNAPAKMELFLSTNYGTGWTKMDLPSNSVDGYYFPTAYSVACSADGTKCVAAPRKGPMALFYNSPLYYSTNMGANWLTSSVPDTNWTLVASSADGRRMVGAVESGRIYLSTDFGATWMPMTNLPVQSWNSLCVSGDGKSIGLTGTNTDVSRNAGALWTAIGLGGSTISCSANGSNWMIAGAQIYTSNDGPATWLTNLSSSSWIGAMSADGCEMIVAGGDGIWEGRTTPSPRLGMQAEGGNVSLSWFLPSTNFVLQENSDIGSGNWQTVPESPILNYTNLHYELAVTNSGSNGFFRLVAQ